MHAISFPQQAQGSGPNPDGLKMLTQALPSGVGGCSCFLNAFSFIKGFTSVEYLEESPKTVDILPRVIH